MKIMIKLFDIFCRIWAFISMFFILVAFWHLSQVEEGEINLGRQNFQLRALRIDGAKTNYYLGTKEELDEVCADSICEIDLTSSPNFIYFKYLGKSDIYYLDTRIPTRFHLYNHAKLFDGDNTQLRLKPVNEVFNKLSEDGN